MPHLVLTGDAECDLVSVLRGNRIRAARYETAAEALAAAPDQAALMVLAGRGGADPAPLPAAFWDEAARKKLRLYCECPSAAPGLAVGEKRVVTLERAVIASGAFGIGLPRLRILSVPEIQFSLLAGPDPLIVLAKVAGYDRAVYGIPGEGAHWLLGRLPGYDALVSSLPLSGFITGRFSPAAEWARVWSYILNWLVPGLAAGGLQVKPSVSPAYGRSEPMPADVQEQTLRRGAEWFFRAKLLVHAAWEDEYWKFRPYPGSGEPPRAAWPCGDGSLGLLEGFNTVIRADGTQPAMWYRRTDCNGTAGGALVAAGAALREPRYVQAGARVCDFLVFRSRLSGGIHADTRHPAFGLLGWHDRDKYHGDANGCDIHYGDDNACALLGLLAAAALIRTDRWDRRILQGILANFRTTGRFGFRHANLTTQRLVEHGWRHFFNGDPIQYEPHFQAYPWACYLWAHRRTGWKELLARTETAIRMTLEAYPDNWKWTNGIQQERARMLLPLAWLVRLEDTAVRRGWLRRIADDLLASQDASGAIREELGHPATGVYGPPKSNGEYGKGEAPLIQENGDPVGDLLYTMNYAAIGLHEAACATGERRYRDAADRLADFFCRTMIRSARHPQLDGGWTRGFDFARWEHGGSNSDRCWGAWCLETGWIQGWILLTLALRELDVSLWTLLQDAAAGVTDRELAAMLE